MWVTPFRCTWNKLVERRYQILFICCTHIQGACTPFKSLLQTSVSLFSRCPNFVKNDQNAAMCNQQRVQMGSRTGGRGRRSFKIWKLSINLILSAMQHSVAIQECVCYTLFRKVTLTRLLAGGKSPLMSLLPTNLLVSWEDIMADHVTSATYLATMSPLIHQVASCLTYRWLPMFG